MEIKKINDDAQRQSAYDLRVKVFVEEQKVPYEEEIDEYEDLSHHFIAQNKDGDTVGAARWRVTPKGVKLERFAVAKEHRNLGIARKLIQAVLDDIDQYPELTQKRKYLHAQVDVVPMYEKFGFRRIGPVFEECNILHQEMEK